MDPRICARALGPLFTTEADHGFKGEKVGGLDHKVLKTECPMDINKSRNNLDPGVVFLRQLLVRTGDKASALLLNSNNMLSEHCQTDAPLWV